MDRRPIHEKLADLSRQLLFFDIDDTLLDHRGAEEAAQRRVYERFRDVFDRLTFDEWLPRYRVANHKAWDAYVRNEIGPVEVAERRFRHPLAELGLDTTRVSELSKDYLGEYPKHWRLNDGAEEILEDASRYGVVGIVSNGFTETQKAKILRFNLRRWVTHVILSEEVGAMKPSRVIFDAAVAAAGGANGYRKLYVGDSYAHDIVGAKGAGWLPVLYNPSGTPAPGPVMYIKKLVDLKPLLE